MINDSMNYKRITIFAKDTQNDMKRFIGHTILILLAEIFLFCPITMSQNNPYKILHDSKLMIMTSLWEGTPMCVLEAMSLGVPVVSTPTDGVKIVVDNGKTGYLDETDEGLVNSCKAIITDTILRENMSDASKKRARELMDIETYKTKILEAYMNARG